MNPAPDLFEALPPLPERSGVTPEMFRHEIHPAAQPCVLRGIVGDWPLVAAAKAGSGNLLRYLAGFDNGRPVEAMVAAPELAGQFFYTDDLKGLNFTRHPVRLSDALQRLNTLQRAPNAHSLYLQSIPVTDHMPGLERANAMPLLDAAIQPRIWIGTRLSVQTHFDLSDNIACLAAGQRRFTLFPPAALPDLYVGPFEFTLAGPPVSLVRPESWDRERHPRFARALEQARMAILEPGDALFIPYGWWHHVQSRADVNVLVNYWWDPAARSNATSPYNALLMALLSLRDLPPSQRAVWKGFFDTYAFGAFPECVAHIPEDVRGALGQHSPEMKRRLRGSLLKALAGELGLAPPPLDP